MATNDEVRDFVHDALAKGVSRSEVETALKEAGWRPEQVRKALSAFAEVPFAVPVPRPTAYLSPRDAFLYLVLFTTLYFSAFHLGRLLFSFVDLALPDPVEGPQMEAIVHDQIQWSVAFLVVAFPTWVYLTLRIARGIARDPAQRQSRVRQWLTYATLFVASGALIGDAVSLVYGLLAGELGARFLLKVAIVGLIATACFGYYRRDLRQDEQEVQS